MRGRVLISTHLALGVVAIAAVVCPPLWLVRLVARVRDDILFFVRTEDPVVALTFDDGPDPQLTDRVLDVLRRHDARATFFLIGSRAKSQPGLIRRIVNEGHEVGNHLWLEERASRLTTSEFERKLVRTSDVLAASAGPVRLLRPGGGFVSRRHVRAAGDRGYRCVLGSVYPHDPHLRWTNWISWRVCTGVHPGAIIILHEGEPSRHRILGTLEHVLPRLRRRGYSVVTVSELLTRAA